MSFPWTDVQFWTVTAAATGAVWLLVKPFVGERRRGGACSHCGSATGTPCQSQAGRERLVTLGNPGHRVG